MVTAAQLVDALGRKKLEAALEVGTTAISNAAVRGRLPSSWFFICKSLAEKENLECPPEIFGMKMPDNTPNVDLAPDCKVSDA